jgi:hypothetical protein
VTEENIVESPLSKAFQLFLATVSQYSLADQLSALNDQLTKRTNEQAIILAGKGVFKDEQVKQKALARNVLEINKLEAVYKGVYDQVYTPNTSPNTSAESAHLTDIERSIVQPPNTAKQPSDSVAAQVTSHDACTSTSVSTSCHPGCEVHRHQQGSSGIGTEEQTADSSDSDNDLSTRANVDESDHELPTSSIYSTPSFIRQPVVNSTPIHYNTSSDSDPEEEIMNQQQMQDLLNAVNNRHTLTADAITQGLGGIAAQTAKLSIPIFYGKLGGQSVEDWLERAKRVATDAGWTPEMQLEYFPTRLESPAADFHASLTNQQKADYATWETNFKAGFLDDAYKQTLKEEITQLQQQPDERARDFAKRIEKRYKTAYGEAIYNSADANVRTLKEEKLKEIFLRGLRKELSELLFCRVQPGADFNSIKNEADNAEKIVQTKKTIEEKSMTTVVSNINKENAKIAQKIEDLQSQFQKLTLNNDLKNTGTEKLVALVQYPEKEKRVWYSDERLRSPRSSERDNWRDRSRSRESYDFKRQPRDDRVSSSFRPRDSSQQLKDRECYYCQKKGHIKRECRKLAFDMKKNNSRDSQPSGRQHANWGRRPGPVQSGTPGWNFQSSQRRRNFD